MDWNRVFAKMYILICTFFVEIVVILKLFSMFLVPKYTCPNFLVPKMCVLTLV